MQVTDLVRSTGAPVARIETTHGDTSHLRVKLISADGTEATVWNRSGGAWPGTFAISSLSGGWITGRYQLEITDMVDTVNGSLTRFCIEAN